MGEVGPIDGKDKVVIVMHSYVMFSESEATSGLHIKQQTRDIIAMGHSNVLFVDFESWIGLQIKRQTNNILLMVCQSYFSWQSLFGELER